MKNRCLNPVAKDFKNYGGRGIEVCEQWKNDLGRFATDMGLPLPGQTLERKNNDGHYSPENCIWADRRTQANNSRANVVLWHEGEERIRFNLTQACHWLGIEDTILVQTRVRNGWSIGTAICTPKGVTAGHYLRDDVHRKIMSDARKVAL